MCPHPARVLDDLDVFLTKLVGVELEEPLGDLRQRGELRLLVDVLFSILVLKEALQKRGRKSAAWSRTLGDKSNLDPHGRFLFPS